MSNAEEFNGLLTTNFNYQIENFVYELCKSLKNKMIRMRKIENEKGELVYQDVVVIILNAALKAAFYTHFRMLMNNTEELGISRGICNSDIFLYKASLLFVYV